MKDWCPDSAVDMKTTDGTVHCIFKSTCCSQLESLPQMSQADVREARRSENRKYALDHTHFKSSMFVLLLRSALFQAPFQTNNSFLVLMESHSQNFIIFSGAIIRTNTVPSERGTIKRLCKFSYQELASKRSKFVCISSGIDRHTYNCFLLVTCMLCVLSRVYFLCVEKESLANLYLN